MAKLVLERAGKLLDEGVFYETQEVEKTIFRYQMGDELDFVLIVADEDMVFKADETKPISVKKLKIPPQTLIIPSMFGIHPIGHLSAIGSYNVLPGIVDKERIVDFGMFHAALPGKISNKEVIGATLMVPVKEI
jgi:hypothetical protein